MPGASPSAARPFAAGLDHRSSPLELRDRVFIPEGELPGFHAELRRAAIEQAIVLSTCDRVEVQGVHPDPTSATAAVTRLLAERAGVPSVHRHVYTHTDAAALRRIFGVAAALESQVLGEPQVLGQVKAAHQAAQAARLMGPELEQILQAAYGAAKRTRNETAIGQRPVTLASAAIQLARDVHGDIARCSGLLVGAGELGELLVEQLKSAGLRSLAVTGPHKLRAEETARRLASHVFSFDGLETRLVDADIVVTALGSGAHIITAPEMERVMVRRRRRPVFIVDLGVPADVEPAVEPLDGVFRYDLDDLEHVTITGRASRGAAAADAWAIVDEELAAFGRARAERDAVPAVVALRRHFEAVRVQVLRQANGDAARATELLVNRLLHDPSEVLRRIASGEQAGIADSEAAARLVAALFRLDETPRDEEKKP
ncbi:MAG TPA: glutamyl-tRNA reductase [Alphaproteobacteria bacterium]|nr:glutamyl-tRNA reductase [Alphaproteobacteria bacterium]